MIMMVEDRGVGCIGRRMRRNETRGDTTEDETERMRGIQKMWLVQYDNIQ